MPVHLKIEIEKLKKKILLLSEIVEDRVKSALKAADERDEALARKIINEDVEIDRFEVEIEEDCLKILALHQPVAIDLRFIIAILKINNDLERIADLAVNIAEKVTILASKKRVEAAAGFPGMADKTYGMLRKSLQALIKMDSAIAREVIVTDDEVDTINREIYDWTKERIRESPENITQLLTNLSISRHLERIADQATNIAEDVIYMIEGEIVRHKEISGLNPFEG